MKNFSYIIPFKFSEERLLTLQKVLENIKELHCDILIVEQGSNPVLPSRNILINEKYIFLKNDLPFNKSWALNVGWKSVESDIIIFGDADNLISIENLFSSLEYMNDYDFVSPHNKLIDLEESENNLDILEILKINRSYRGELDHQKMPLCGGMTIFKRDSLERIGGWPEEFFGWGAEDDAMSIKVKHFLRWKEMDLSCYHLYHTRVVPDIQYYQRNLMIYQNYISASKEKLDEYISQIRPIIGDKNRKFS